MRNRAASVRAVVLTLALFVAAFAAAMTGSRPAAAGWYCGGYQGYGECGADRTAPTLAGACEAEALRWGLKVTSIYRRDASSYWCDMNFGTIKGATWPVCPGGSIANMGRTSGCQGWEEPEGFGGCTACGAGTRSSSGPGAPGGQIGGSGDSGVGDPITLSNGNKFHAVTDYRSSGADTLEFTRYYNALNWVGPTPLGYGWRHNFMAGLHIYSSTGVWVHRPDGRIENFTSATGGNPWNAVKGGVVGKLTKTASGWTYTRPDDTVETYNTSGQLQTVTKKNGYTQTIVRDAGGVSGLWQINDSHGRTLTLTHTNYGGAVGSRLTQVTDPDGSVYKYQYQGINAYNSEPLVLKKAIYPDDTPGTDTDNPFVTYHYEDSRFPYGLTGITDETGQRIATWSYNAEGRGLTSERGGGADSVGITYNADGTKTVSNPLGKDFKYSFSTIALLPRITRIDRLASASTPAATMTFQYDANGFVSRKTDWNGTITEYVHDSRGLQTSRTEAFGTPEERTVTTAWDPTYRLPTQIVEPERTTTFTYHPDGLLHTRTVTDTTTHVVPYGTNGETRTWTYTYNAQGLVETVDGPRTGVTDVTTYAYDAVTGDLVGVTDALGHATQITQRDASGRPQKTLDANGVETTLAYDARGRLTTRTVDSGTGGTPATTTFTHDFSSRMTGMTLPNGSSLNFEHDDADRLTAIENDLGERIEYTYDPMGNRTGQTVKASDLSIVRTAAATFDDLGQMLKSIGAYAGEETAYAYDANGNRLSVTDPLGNVTQSGFDALNRLVTVTDALLETAAYGYDAAGNMDAATDQRSLTTSYVHNGFGEVIQQSSPDTGATVFEYDSAGNRTRRTDARGVVTEWTWDALGRVTGMHFPASPSENVTYTYDDATPGRYGIGRLASVTDDSGSTSYRYDARGNTVRVDSVIGAQAYVTEYAWDVADRLVQMTYPSGRIVDYVRDSIGRVTSVTTKENAAAPAVTLASGATYEPFGPLDGVTYGNGVTLVLAYDLDGRVTTIDAADGLAPVLDLDYALYDLAGNIRTITDAGGTGRDRSYVYDELHRLTDASGGLPTETYAYDEVGNRTARTVGAAAESYAYDAASNRLLSVTGAATRSLTWSDSGNTARDDKGGGTVLDYAYDSADRLVAVTQGTTTLADYVHNAMGQRVAKTVGGATTHFLYDLSGRLVGEADGATGAATAEYIWLEGMPLAFVQGGAVYYIHADHLGTPQRLTDGTKAVVWDASYAPFGGATVSGSVTFNLRFPGQYEDAETGLHYNYFRDYDPALGRYVQSDPIGLQGGWNTYAYVGGNPIVRLDPFGLLPTCKKLYLKEYRNNSGMGFPRETFLYEIFMTWTFIPNPITPGPELSRDPRRAIGPDISFEVWGLFLQRYEITDVWIKDVKEIWRQRCTDTVKGKCGKSIPLEWESDLDLSEYEETPLGSRKEWRWVHRNLHGQVWLPPVRLGGRG